ncbi:MAG: DUF5677 domain-containing protein [candidate division Zixibacteria bacterium]|nr:DUF5677 domain-containing protein [candidate division Zixibacteria bacterium]
MMDGKYLQGIRTLESLCKTASKLSIATSGREVSTWREAYGSHIFGKICLTGIAILKLLPQSVFYFAPKGLEVWDISSVCILTRSLIDTYNVFHYLIIQKVENEELEFRFVLWNLHSETERLKMLELSKSKSEKLEKIKQYVESLKEKLGDNKFYQKLDLKEQKKCCTGEKGIYLKNTDISRNAGINPDYYKSTYKYLSQYVHTYPFSISQIIPFKADDTESQKLFKPIIGYCTGYLCVSTRDFVNIFPDQSGNIPSEIIKTIEDWEYIMRNIFSDPTGAAPTSNV